MAQLNNNYTTTFQVGDNAYVQFSWFISTDDYKLLGSFGDGRYTYVEDRNYLNEPHVVVNNMVVTGTGDMYRNRSDYKFIGSTCAEVENKYSSAHYSYPFAIADYVTLDSGEKVYDYDTCWLVETINIGSGITGIGHDLFAYPFQSYYATPLYEYYGLYKISYGSLIIEDNITSIGDIAKISDDTFRENNNAIFSSVGYVDIRSKNIEILGDGALNNHVDFGLINYTFDKVKKLGENAFHTVTKVDKVFISKDVDYMGVDTFYNCVNLVDINENNYINCECEGRVFYLCPKVEVITLGDNTKQLSKHYQGYYYAFMYVDLNTGSNCDENGYQQVQVITNITEYKTEKYIVEDYAGTWSDVYGGTDWLGYNIRINAVIEEGSDLIHIQAGLNKVIVIKSYDDGEYELAVGNGIKRVKFVELTDVNASDIHIAVGNKVMALSK